MVRASIDTHGTFASLFGSQLLNVIVSNLAVTMVRASVRFVGSVLAIPLGRDLSGEQRPALQMDELLPDLRAFRLDRVRCVWLGSEAYRSQVSKAIELPRWLVEFPSDRQPSLTVDIDRRTGDARVYRQLREFGFTADELCSRAT